MKTVLLTGGAGYIGSHTSVCLLAADVNLVIVDNLCNSHARALERIKEISGANFHFYKQDVRDIAALEKIFDSHAIDAVIHFAGLKAVGESVEKPLDYYNNNLQSTLSLLQAMSSFQVKNIVFSSSATVYGDPHMVPIQEDFPLSAHNPYGRSKLMIEEILRDLHVADSDWSIALLRYFNPVGAHQSGLIGEDPNGIPNNLFPYISQVAIGKLKQLSVFGNDYPTPDGTGVRDYIHVMDLAQGHQQALQALSSNQGQVLTVNLGTGQGYSVLEMVNAFHKVSKKQIPYEVVQRRSGDIATCYADPSYAKKILQWQAQRGIEEMCQDAWRWQSMNPKGYR